MFTKVISKLSTMIHTTAANQSCTYICIMRIMILFAALLFITSCEKETTENPYSIRVRYEVELDGSCAVKYNTAGDTKIDTISGDWSHEFTAMVPYGESRFYGCTLNPYGISSTVSFTVRYYVDGFLRNEYSFPNGDQSGNFSQHVWYGSGVSIP